MKILFLSHTPMGGPFVVGSHHLARSMAGMGHRVVHLSPPVTPAHLPRFRQAFERRRLMRWMASGERIHDVIDLVPGCILPWALVRAMSHQPHVLFARLLRRSVMRALRAHDMDSPDLVFVDEPRLGGLVAQFPLARLVYRPTDLYALIRQDESILDAERFLIGAVHRFIATSGPVAAHLERLGAGPVLLLENGVDLEHFLAPPGGSPPVVFPAPGPYAIYAGALDARFGFDLLEHVARKNPAITFILIGPSSGSTPKTLSSLQNVHFLGPIGFESLPAYLRSADIGILPLSRHPSNSGRSPMKLYEYAAAGLPVVATRTEELARRGLNFVAMADSAEEFSTQVRSLVSGDLKMGEGVDAARKQSWLEKSQAALSFALEGQVSRA